MLSARQAIQNLKEYHPPLAGRDGMRLDFNENTVGCSARVLQRVRQITLEDLARIRSENPSRNWPPTILELTLRMSC